MEISNLLIAIENDRQLIAMVLLVGLVFGSIGAFLFVSGRASEKAEKAKSKLKEPDSSAVHLPHA